MKTQTVERYYPHARRRNIITGFFIAAFLFFSVYGAVGQTADGYLNVQYMGKVNGIHKVQVKNLQSCKVDLAFYVDGKTISPILSYGQINASDTKVFDITGNANLIKVKALTVCNWRGNPPIWLILDYVSLPVKFKRVTVTVIKE